jgi:tetratricopeptide (TPR) repeat protein
MALPLERIEGQYEIVAKTHQGSLGRSVLWTLLAALLVRLLYFAEHARSAFFGIAILDEAYYDGAARGLLDGQPEAVLGDSFRPPLYPLLLAACYRLGGAHLDVAAAIAAQHLLGIATVVLVTVLGARLARRASAGLVAGLLFALAGPPLFFEGERLIATLFTFLATSALVLASRVAARPQSLAAWCALGATIGLATEARANGLLLVVPLVVVPMVLLPKAPGRRGMLTAVAACFTVLLAFGALRAQYGGGFGLLPSAGGVNLYLGNERGADGMVPRQDRAVTYGEQYRDSVAVFAEQEFAAARARGEAHGAGAQAISRYWTGRAVQEIVADPLGRVRLLARKFVLLLANREIPNNKRYAFILEHESPLLRRLPVRWWLLLALAPLGLAFAWRHGDPVLAAWIAGNLLLLALGIVLFFVNSRFRIPLWSGMAALAGVGTLVIADTLRARDWPRTLRLGAIVAVLALTSFWVGRDLVMPGAGRDFFFRSYARLERGELEGALTDAEVAVRAMPEDAAAWTQLGNVHQRADLPDRALEAYLRAQRLSPGEPRVANNIGVVLEAIGRPDDAYRSYRHATRLEPTYPLPWVNAALLELRASRADLARESLARVAALGFESPQHTAAQALLLRAQGEESRARVRIDQAPAAAREAIALVLEDAEIPLDPTVLGLGNEPPSTPAVTLEETGAGKTGTGKTGTRKSRPGNRYNVRHELIHLATPAPLVAGRADPDPRHRRLGLGLDRPRRQPANARDAVDADRLLYLPVADRLDAVRLRDALVAASRPVHRRRGRERFPGPVAGGS